VTDYADKIGARKLLKRNYRELLFVFAAFALMVLATNFFVGRMLRAGLYKRAEEITLTAGANVRAGLSEAEATLLNSYYIVQGMIEQKTEKQEILGYLANTTEWMRRRDQGLLRYYGIYGYINGEHYDGLGINPDSNYIPQRRPWYQTAVRNVGSVAYTAPYTDQYTGDTVVSAVRNIDVKSGDLVGILVVEIDINWLVEYISSLSPADDGYGMLLSQNMTLIAHPDRALLGRQLQELGGSYGDIAMTLRGGGSVFARRIQDSGGAPAIVFFTRIFNGWHVGTVVPYFSFYRNLYISAMTLTTLGIILSMALCYMLLRISAAKMRADRNNESKSSFLASMSHEIRTPMNAINGMAELLLRGELSEQARGYAQDIKQAGNNLLSIINDILDFSKIEAGKLEIIPAEYAPASLINDAVNVIQVRLAEKPIRFSADVDGSIPSRLVGDEVRLRQIMLNLLSNAVKYTDKGSVSLTVAAEKQEGGRVWLKIAVADTGKGMKPEDVEMLFGNFVQVDTKKNRGIEGTGLGLAITKKLCEAMGGGIGVESKYGSGSTFTVRVPQGVSAAGPEGLGEAGRAAENHRGAFTIPSARLLVVDDIAINLKVAEGLLAPYNAAVDSCVSGAEAVEMVKRREYDMVFMDHMMPGMDGVEATAAIRGWEAEQKAPGAARPALPVIALTANAVVGMKEMFAAKGFSDFLSKPIDVSKLDEALKRWIPKGKIEEKRAEPKSAGEINKPAASRPLLDIPGIDATRGIAMAGGKEERFRKLLTLFRADAEQRIAALKTSGEDAAAVAGQAHAIKGVAANIGANEAAAQAARLESACKAGDVGGMKENIDGLVKLLAELVDSINEAER
jgi:signal transduction histidine kinase/HPt (histidine-containing phosphotransfer) domain-containing protein/FixJ family two-component response regulator